jgi:hypothetical protein
MGGGGGIDTLVSTKGHHLPFLKVKLSYPTKSSESFPTSSIGLKIKNYLVKATCLQKCCVKLNHYLVFFEKHMKGL